MEEYRNIWVIALIEDGEPDIRTLKLIGYARLLGDNVGSWVEALVIGKNVGEDKAKELIMYGVDNVHLVSSEKIDLDNLELVAKIIFEVAKEKKPEFILFPDDKRSRALAGYISAKFGSPLLSECIKIDIDPYDRKLRGYKPVFEGQLLAVLEAIGGYPQIATIKTATYSLPMKDEFRSGRVYKVELDLDKLGVKTEVVGREVIEERPNNWWSKVAFVVGNKVLKEKYEEAKKVLNRMGVFVGATKIAVDEGVAPTEDLVGPMGKIIRPDLLVTFGSSEIPDYLFGLEKKPHLLALVGDSNEPLAKVARYYAVGDPNELIDLILGELKKKFSE